MRTPVATTTTVVDTAITLAAFRTDTGSLRNRDMRRSISLGRGMF
jgi:hypothetical protein